MKRKIIVIDKEKCNGCGICVSACAEGALGLAGGKAELLREDYCDGLGACLPACPVGAITFEEREAKPFAEVSPKHFACPSMSAKEIKPAEKSAASCPSREPQKNKNSSNAAPSPSQLRQWPAQIKLVAPNAAYFENADLLISADCCAFACGNFHEKFMKNKITLTGCPKLDNADYSQKLFDIIKNNNIRSVSVARMEVPCCAGIAGAVLEAVKKSGKNIGVKINVISINGEDKQQ